MDLLTVILACSVYLDDGLVRAIAETNSHANPYAVIDATYTAALEDPAPEPRSLDDALQKTDAIAQRGGEPLLGLMQIPRVWASMYGQHAVDLFEPCTNISIGTAMLSEFDYECSRADFRRARGKEPFASSASTAGRHRLCVVSKYAQAIRMPDFALVVQLELQHQPQGRGAWSSLSKSQLFPEEATSRARAWGNDRLFFEAAIASEPTLIDPFAPAAVIGHDLEVSR